MESTGRIQCEFEHWPVVLTRPPEGIVSDEELESFFTRYNDEMAKHQGHYGSILDLRRHSALTPKQRKRIAQSMVEAESRSHTQCVAAAMVFESALLRGMLTAILWLKRPAYDTRVFATVSEAHAWVMEMVEAADHERNRRAS